MNTQQINRYSDSGSVMLIIGLILSNTRGDILYYLDDCDGKGSHTVYNKFESININGKSPINKLLKDMNSALTPRCVKWVFAENLQ